MSAWSDLRDGIRQAILLQDRVQRLARGVDKMEERLLDHDRRLIRIETLIELAQARQSQLPPP